MVHCRITTYKYAQILCTKCTDVSETLILRIQASKEIYGSIIHILHFTRKIHLYNISQTT